MIVAWVICVAALVFTTVPGLIAAWQFIDEVLAEFHGSQPSDPDLMAFAHEAGSGREYRP